MAHGIARWSLVTVILVLVGPAALAQTEPTTTQPVPWVQAAQFRMDCGQDLHRLCHGVQPGEGRLIQCLSSHRSELSPACISRLAAARPTSRSGSPFTKYAKSRPAIRQPIYRRCCDSKRPASLLRSGYANALRWNVQGNGGVVKCLSSHRMELSPTCDAFFKEMLATARRPKGCPENHASHG